MRVTRDSASSGFNVGNITFESIKQTVSISRLFWTVNQVEQMDIKLKSLEDNTQSTQTSVEEVLQMNNELKEQLQQTQ